MTIRLGRFHQGLFGKSSMRLRKNLAVQREKTRKEKMETMEIINKAFEKVEKPKEQRKKSIYD